VAGAGLSRPREDTSGGVYGSITFSDATNKDGLTINGQRYALIHSLEDMASTKEVSNVHYALAGDIDAAEWSAANLGENNVSVIATLQNSTLTGLGHVINNLTFNRRKQYAGLIGRVIGTNGVTIRDLGLTNVSVYGSSYVAPLIGANFSELPSYISNVYVEGEAVTATSGAAGGLIGSSSSAYISNVYAAIDVTTSGTSSSSSAGGLIGVSGGTLYLDHAHATGNVSNTKNLTGAGGLVGAITARQIGAPPSAPSSITASYATGEVSGLANVGGLVGEVNGRESGNATVTDSFATGAVSGGAGVGGLIGAATNVDVNNTYATGAITVHDSENTSSIGGLAGTISGNASITYSHANGNIAVFEIDTREVGGLVGAMFSGSQVSYCYATGNVEGIEVDGLHFTSILFDTRIDIDNPGHAGGNMGGLVGYSLGSISNSHASGDIQGHGSVGGLVGGLGGAGKVTNSSASGNVIGVVGVGGIAGSVISGGTINGAIATGDVYGNYQVGGIAGALTTGTIENSIADNTVSGADGDNTIGAIVGSWDHPALPVNADIATVSNNHYNQDKNPEHGQLGVADEGMPTGGGGLTTGQLADSNIQDAILSGGDVGEAIADYNTAHVPAPSLPSSPDTSAPSSPIATTPPSAPNIPDAPIATTPPSAPNIPDAPIATTPPSAPNIPDVPIVDAPVSILPNPEDVLPPSAIPNTAEIETVRTAAAQAMENNRQLLGDVISNALGEQVAGFESARIPLDQLMAHLTQTAANGNTPSTTKDRQQNYNSSVEGISVEGECYSARGDRKACE
jgi:hypothetical protein